MRAVVLLLLLAVVGSVEARDWEIAPFVGYRVGGEVELAEAPTSVAVEPATTWGLTLGRLLSPETRVELTWSHQATELEHSDFALDVDHLHVAGVYEPARDQPMGGYVLASVGVSVLDPGSPDAETSTRFSGSIGGGGRFRLGERISLRLEARGWGILTDAGAGAFCAGGCVFVFAGDGIFQLELSAGLAVAF
jgi:hypothetical protein